MTGANWQYGGSRAGNACLILLLLPGLATASGSPWLPLRNENPFLQVFGLPAFEPADPGDTANRQWRLSMDVSNHADVGSTQDESVTLDGESYRITLAARQPLNDRLALGIDVPIVRHAGGILDAPIENWHEFWGLSNSKRSGPRDQLAFRYDSTGGGNFFLDAPAGGIGDIQLFGSLLLGDKHRSAGRRAGLRAGIKLPTGDADRLLGSGAVDTWVEVNGSQCCLGGRDTFRLSAAAGLLFTGRGDVLPEIQRQLVGFGGIAAGWSLGERFEMQAQINAQSAYFDSAVDELGSHSVQIALGGRYAFSGRNHFLSIALIEDIFANATTDVALHLSLTSHAHDASRPAR